MINGMTIHEYLTKDHGKVRQVVEFIGSKDIAGQAHEVEQKYWLMAQEPLSSDAQMAAADESNRRAEREEAKRITETYLLRLTSLAKSLLYELGQKHFIFFPTGVPSSLIYGNQAGNPNELGGRARFDPSDRLLETRNEEMYKEFAANCEVYAFDARESAMATDLFAYDRITFENRRSNRGMLSTSGVFQDATNIFQNDKTTGGNSLKRMAELTGGKYFSNINLYKKNLDQVQSLTGTYYVLGYYVEEAEDGRFHEIKVEVRRPDCQVRAQSGYFNPKPFKDYTDLEKKLHLFDLALNEQSFSRLPLNFPISYLSYASKEGSWLEVLARVPIEVTERFDGKRVEYVAPVFNDKNDIRDLRRLEVDPRSLHGRTVIFTSATSLEPGKYVSRLVIRDMSSGLSAVSSIKASVPNTSQSSLRLGTPLLLEEDNNCIFIESGTKERRSRVPWSEAYSFDRTTLSPISGEVSGFRRQLKAVVPFNVPGISEPDVALSAQIIDTTAGQTWPVMASLAGVTRHSLGKTAILEIPLLLLKPGNYFFYVNGVDRLSKTVAHTMTAFSVRED